VVANVDGRAHESAEEWPKLLSAQLCSPVRWRHTLETLLAAGTQTFVELGPGGVLTGLARRVLPTADAVAVSVSTPDDLDRLIDVIAGRSDAYQAAIDQRSGERFHMSERLVLSPAGGLFAPEPRLVALGPGKSGSESVTIEVGGLVGHVGEVEVRSAFAGTLEGVLVLNGERVTAGQPVAWIRATSDVALVAGGRA
jgi:[acyl-carrier-protein] S-malonyltransferase